MMTQARKDEKMNNVESIKYFTPNELSKFIRVLEHDDSLYATRNEAMFKLALYCGLRASEVGLLKKEFYNPIQKSIYCRRLKGSLNNTIRLIDIDIFPKTLRALNRYLRCPDPYPESQLLFPSRNGTPISRQQLDKLMRYYCQQANIKDINKWHFHVLKHTCGVTLADEGLDVKDVQFWLGHKCIDNTLIYMQYTCKQQDALYEKLLKGKKRNSLL